MESAIRVLVNLWPEQYDRIFGKGIYDLLPILCKKYPFQRRLASTRTRNISKINGTLYSELKIKTRRCILGFVWPRAARELRGEQRYHL